MEFGTGNRPHCSRGPLVLIVHPDICSPVLAVTEPQHCAGSYAGKNCVPAMKNGRCRMQPAKRQRHRRDLFDRSAGEKRLEFAHELVPRATVIAPSIGIRRRKAGVAKGKSHWARRSLPGLHQVGSGDRHRIFVDGFGTTYCACFASARRARGRPRLPQARGCEAARSADEGGTRRRVAARKQRDA
jgi:hypothetical protein